MMPLVMLLLLSQPEPLPLVDSQVGAGHHDAAATKVGDVALQLLVPLGGTATTSTFTILTVVVLVLLDATMLVAAAAAAAAAAVSAAGATHVVDVSDTSGHAAATMVVCFRSLRE
jgi:hypothetical protein